MSGSICTLLSEMVIGLVSLEDSRYRGTVVTATGIMDVYVDRSGNAEKHSIWNRRCRKVLSILLCTQ